MRAWRGRPCYSRCDMSAHPATRRPHRRRRRARPERGHPRRRQVGRPTRGIECVGLEDSFDGLIEPNRSRVLTPRDVTGILRLGGTILGTVNTRQPVRRIRSTTSDGPRDYSDRVVEMFHRHGARRARRHRRRRHAGHRARVLRSCGIPIVGVPKTIDNDIVGTTNCFGFDTAVAFATDAIDRLHTTAEAHKRIMVVEVMGRYAGLDRALRGRRRRRRRDPHPRDPVRPRRRSPSGCASATAGARSSASSSSPRARIRRAARMSLVEAAHGGHVERLGGMGAQVCEALRDADRQGDALRRARPPAARRRADQLRSRAGDAVRRQGGRAGPARASSARWSRSHPPDIVARRLEDVVGKTKTVPLDFDLLPTARALGVTFGD